MSWWKEQIRRARQLIRRDQFDDDLAEEMRLHLDLRAAEKPERETRVRFGNLTRLKEDSRSAWGWPFLESLMQDIRYGVRTLAADRAFTVTAIVSLAIGIGANTAIFSMINAVMLRTLPVENPNQLVKVASGDSGSFTNPLWEETRDRQNAFSGIFAFGTERFDLNSGGETHLSRGLWVSGDFFRVLGVPALRGRVINTQDDRHGGGSSGPVAVISYGFWKANYNSDPEIIGKTISLDRRKFEIVGVTPAWFRGLDNDSAFDVAIPIGTEPLFHPDRSALTQRSWWWLRVVGRLNPNESIQQAQSRMQAAGPAVMLATTPPNWDADGKKRYQSRNFTLKPAAAGFSSTGTEYRTALFTLMALVAIVLVIVCANVANLLLARSTARQRELSVRLAIGAGRGRIVRQLLTESVLLAVAGASCGLALALWGSRVLVHFLSTADREVQIDTSLDWTAGAFIAAVVIVTTFLFGLAPAFRGASAAPGAVLKETARGAVRGGARFTLGKALVTFQVALSLLLLVGAALFAGSFNRLVSVDTGFDSRNVQLVNAEVPQSVIPKDQRIALFDRVLDRLRLIPGVQSASRSDLTPISNSVWNNVLDPKDGLPQGAGDDARLVYCNRVSPAYFKTMGTPLLAGRDFTDLDTANSPKVVVVGESTARAFWGAVSPLGKTLNVPGDAPGSSESFQVIGVVKDIKYEELKETTLKTAYFAYRQDPNPRPSTSFELRLNQPLAQVAPAVRTAVGDVDKDVSIQIHSLERQVSDSLIQPRLVAILATFFGGVALVLAATGLYGIIAYSVARRRAEIGLRMALGARYSSVLWLVLRDVAVMLVLGAAVGLTASHYATKFVESMIYGIKPTDPIVLAAALTVLIIAAAIAAYIPARKAARMDPMDALRTE